MQTDSKFVPLGKANLVFLIVFLTLVFVRSDVVFDDMSLGWHLLTGNYVLDNLSIPHTDIISYTRAGKPWVPYEWLSGLILAIVGRTAGQPGLLVFVAALVAGTWTLLYRRCAETKDSFAPFAFVLTLCAARVALGLWSARPYTLIYPLVLILVTCLERFRRGFLPFKKLCLALSCITIIWTNMHPSFMLGPGIILAYLIGEVLQRAFSGTGEPSKRSKQLFLLLALCAACTLLNPFGCKLHLYLLKLSATWPEQAKLIGESEAFSVFVVGGPLGIGFELLVALGVIGLAFNRAKLVACHIILFLLLGHMSFSMARLVPLFILVNLPFIAQWLAGIAAIDSENVSRPVSAIVRLCNKLAANAAGAHSRELRRLPALTTAAFFLVAMVQNSNPSLKLLKADFNSIKLPTSTAQYIVDHHLPERQGLSMYAWGGYLRWKFGLHVFIDDSNEFFDRDAYLAYLRIVGAGSGWEQTLVDDHISWVLLDKRYKLAAVLRSESNWTAACEDPASILFVRKSNGTTRDMNRSDMPDVPPDSGSSSP